MRPISVLALAFALVVLGVSDLKAQERDIVDTAVAAGSFQTLAAALTAADLIDPLRTPGPFTVFAPTDEAFALLGEDTINSLVRAPKKLRPILNYHVVPGEISLSDLIGKRQLRTVNGQRVEINVEGGRVSIDGARVTTSDIRCRNGVIHVIDSVLIPTSDTIPTVAENAGTFGTLLAAAKAAGLVDALSGGRDLTVLAPTDEAFAKIPEATLQALLRPENRKALEAVLLYHVIPGRAYASDVLLAGTAKTLEGESVEFSITAGQLRVGPASIVATDIEAANGVIHVIDTVLMPKKELTLTPQGRPVVGFFIDRPDEALAAQLGIQRNQSLVVERLTKNGNAQRDGLQKFDVITEINGLPATEKNLDKVKKSVGVGGNIAFAVIRKGKPILVDVEVGADRH